MDIQLQRWLTETAYYKTPTSVSSTGTETLGAATSFLCRTELQEVIHGPNFIPRAGNDVEWMHLIFTLTAIPRNARIWLPGDSTSNASLARQIRRAETVRDEMGVISHYEIYV